MKFIDYKIKEISKVMAGGDKLVCSLLGRQLKK